MKQKMKDLHNNSILLTLQDSFILVYDQEDAYSMQKCYKKHLYSSEYTHRSQYKNIHQVIYEIKVQV